MKRMTQMVLVTMFVLLVGSQSWAGDKEERMVLPPPGQIGVVVKNLDEAIAYYSKTFGMGPFETIVFAPPKHWVKGELCPVKLKIGMCQWGPLQIELIEALEGDSPHKQFLQEKGEGLHHVGFFVDNYDEWLAYLKEKGIDVLCNAEGDNFRAANMQSDAIGGVIFEVIEMREARP